jgi:hypothetical protein
MCKNRLKTLTSVWKNMQSAAEHLTTHNAFQIGDFVTESCSPSSSRM